MRKKPSAMIAWERSERFRQISSASAKRNLLRFAEAPRCGAKRKYDGQPCQQPGTGAGGRCRYHGGATPKGSGQWHRPKWPDKLSPNMEAKLQRKLDDLQKAYLARRRRVEAMSPEQRAKYEAWLLSHEPTTEAKRAARRASRKMNQELRAQIVGRAAIHRDVDPERAALELRIAELRAKIAERETERAHDELALKQARDGPKCLFIEGSPYD